MTQEPDRESDCAPGPRELPEQLFRQGEDWKWLQAARRERRRQERKERIAAWRAALGENRALVLAIAAPVLMLSLAWMLGAARW